MLYQIKIYDRHTNVELHSQFIERTDLMDFVRQVSPEIKIEVLDEHGKKLVTIRDLYYK